MSEKVNLILQADEINQKIKRIAYEIFENNFTEKKVVFAGIDGQGYELARLIADKFTSISKLESVLVKVSIDKDNPHFDEVELDVELNSIKKTSVVLVDDVLNTGRTMMYSLRPFFDINAKKIQTAVLVDRGHSLFPVKSTYTGLSLSTTLNEHIEVKLKGEKSEVCLI